MSYILNALRKSEQERLDNQVITLENRIQSRQETEKNKPSVWMIVLVIINLFFLAYSLWSFSKKNSEIDENKVAFSEQQEAIAIKPIAKPEKKGLASTAAVAKEIITYPPRPMAEKIKNQKAKPPPVSNPPEIKKSPRRVVRVKPVKRIIAAVKPVKITKKTGEQKKDFPFLSELDYDFRRTVPAITINVYVYAEEKQDRFIMVNMKKYLPGQKLDSGMMIKEIRVNSLLVEYQNRVFQIKRR